MTPWPQLAARAFYLDYGAGGSLFFYDSLPGAGQAGPVPAPPPVFVLIHGLGDEADTWRHLIPLLNSRGFRVLAPDLPGFGRSTTSGRINLAAHADAVLKLIEAACPPGPVFLAGNSMGAALAEMAALEKPHLVRGLVLIDGSIPGGPANPGFFALAKLLYSRKWYRAFRDNPGAALLSLYPYYADLDAMGEDDKVFLKERVMARVHSSTQEEAYFATQRSLVWSFIFPARYERAIKEYRRKILLLWGDKDRIVPLSSTELFRSLNSNIRLNLIEGAGHLPQQEKPVETTGSMADFADSIIDTGVFENKLV